MNKLEDESDREGGDITLWFAVHFRFWNNHCSYKHSLIQTNSWFFHCLLLPFSTISFVNYVPYSFFFILSFCAISLHCIIDLLQSESCIVTSQVLHLKHNIYMKITWSMNQNKLIEYNSLVIVLNPLTCWKEMLFRPIIRGIVVFFSTEMSVIPVKRRRNDEVQCCWLMANIFNKGGKKRKITVYVVLGIAWLVCSNKFELGKKNSSVIIPCHSN